MALQSVTICSSYIQRKWHFTSNETQCFSPYKWVNPINIGRVKIITKLQCKMYICILLQNTVKFIFVHQHAKCFSCTMMNWWQTFANFFAFSTDKIFASIRDSLIKFNYFFETDQGTIENVNFISKVHLPHCMACAHFPNFRLSQP